MFEKLLGSGGINGALGSISKGLNMANKIIPIYQQVKPLITNAKGTFETVKNVVSGFGSSKHETENEKQNIKPDKKTSEQVKEIISTTNGPTFFQ